MPELRIDITQGDVAVARNLSLGSPFPDRSSGHEFFNNTDVLLFHGSVKKRPLGPALSKVSEKTETGSEPATPMSLLDYDSPGGKRAGEKCTTAVSSKVSEYDATLLNVLMVPIIKVWSKSTENISKGDSADCQKTDVEKLRRCSSCESLFPQGSKDTKEKLSLRKSFESLLECQGCHGHRDIQVATEKGLVGVRPRPFVWQPSVEHLHHSRVAPRERNKNTGSCSTAGFCKRKEEKSNPVKPSDCDSSDVDITHVDKHISLGDKHISEANSAENHAAECGDIIDRCDITLRTEKVGQRPIATLLRKAEIQEDRGSSTTSAVHV